MFSSFKYIGACIWSIHVIHMTQKMSPFATKHGYDQSDTAPSTDNFVIMCLHMFIFELFFIFVYVPIVLKF